MTISRALTNTGLTGAEITTNLNDTVNHLFGQMLGVLTNVAGTNTVTARLPVSTGFTSLSSGAMAFLKPATANTGAVTLQIRNATDTGDLTTALGVKTAAGAALAAGDLVPGTLYMLSYTTADGYWRVLTELGGEASSAIDSGDLPYIYVYSANATFVSAAETSLARIVVIGGGGSGGAARSSPGARGSGGGAGGTAIKTASLLASTSLTIVVGTGGASVSTSSGVVNGNPGTASSVTDGGDIDLIANGGGAGQAANTGTAAGGAGGTATGGDYNFAGGNGGDCAINTTGSGGGAPGLMQAGFSAAAPSGGSTVSGGAGLGGTSSSGTGSSVAGGIAPFLVAILHGVSVALAAGGTGSTSGTAGNGGPFAGGGGSLVTGGNGGYGGGGGGAGAAAGTSTSGIGGAGLVIIAANKPRTS